MRGSTTRRGPKLKKLNLLAAGSKADQKHMRQGDIRMAGQHMSTAIIHTNFTRHTIYHSGLFACPSQDGHDTLLLFWTCHANKMPSSVQVEGTCQTIPNWRLISNVC